MVDILGGKNMAVMQKRTDDLEQQVGTLSTQLTATIDRLAAINNQLAAAIEQSEAYASELMVAEQRAEALAGVVTDQAAAIERLTEAEEQRKELDRQIRINMARIERQATIDITEFRQTSLVLAEHLLTFQKLGTGA